MGTLENGNMDKKNLWSHGLILTQPRGPVRKAFWKCGDAQGVGPPTADEIKDAKENCENRRGAADIAARRV